jgi:ABC-type uncharacterized transport system permease subunit
VISRVQGILGLMFGGLMCVAALIAILASRGLPKREMYWTCFAASEITASILFFLMRRLNAANLGMYLLEKALLGVLLFLMGVSISCGVGVFTFKTKSWPKEEESESKIESPEV